MKLMLRASTIVIMPFLNHFLRKSSQRVFPQMNQNINKLVFKAKIREGFINSKSVIKRGKGNQPPRNNKTNNKDINII